MSATAGVAPLRPNQGRLCFQVRVLGVRIQLLGGCGTEDLGSHLAVGRGLPSVPCERLAPPRLVSSKACKERRPGRAAGRELDSRKLVTGVAARHMGVPWARAPGPAHTGEDDSMRARPPEAGPWDHPSICPPQVTCSLGASNSPKSGGKGRAIYA